MISRSLLASALMLAPAPALACLPPLPPPPNAVEPPPPTVEQRAEAIVRGSDTIVYGVLTRGTEEGRDGRLRIIHVYKGALRSGSIVTIKPSWGFDPPPCAGLMGSPPPRFKGDYGVLAWSGEPTLDWVSDERLAVMFDRGWLTRTPRKGKPQRVGTGSSPDQS